MDSKICEEGKKELTEEYRKAAADMLTKLAMGETVEVTVYDERGFFRTTVVRMPLPQESAMEGVEEGIDGEKKEPVKWLINLVPEIPTEENPKLEGALKATEATSVGFKTGEGTAASQQRPQLVTSPERPRRRRRPNAVQAALLQLPRLAIREKISDIKKFKKGDEDKQQK